MAPLAVVVVGLNHKTAPIAVLERLAIGDERLPKALHQLGTYEHVLEGAVLSTCNRIEVYAAVTKFHGGAQDLRNFLAEFCHVAPEDFVDHLYTYHDDSAVRHLFRVASGIDSLVVGEGEILGQVRRSYQIASAEGMTGRLLGTAFRRALRVGKRARTETSIARNPVSVSSAAVELARRAFEGSLEGRRIAIIGAGKMGRLAARALASAGASSVVLVNRGEERARAFSHEFEMESYSFDELETVMSNVDIVISSTSAAGTVIEAARVREAAARRRSDTPLFIVDIAVPRDVEVEVGTIPRVVLRDIEDLRSVVETNLGSRLGEVSKVEDIIGSELDRFLEWERSSESAPIAAALVAAAEEIRRAEVERLRGDLSVEQREAVDQLTRRIVSKMLHAPLKNLREVAGSKQGYVHLTVLRDLFELDDDL
ncbi:MAG TPA: glutamyl-tRNA reductase [Actinomycetota bacterium]|nr:glutamyl-tRNA reductase [Actinomycetota bacterium]